MLQEHGYETVVFDNFQTGFKEAVHGTHIEGDLTDRATLEKVFAQSFDAVMHFAASTSVDESVYKPNHYYRNNIVGTLNLLDTMVEHGAKKFIFSSTAAVYGEPQQLPVDEHHPKKPVNPYGFTKWVIEQALADYETAFDFRSIAFRYFNAAGCDPKMRTGERRNPPSHLIPIVLEVAQKKRPHFNVFGTDYPTKDGTCVRDFVHVTDLCDAHLKALESLLHGGKSGRYNLGSGSGYSVLEVVEAARRITGKSIEVKQEGRRAGDSVQLVADSKKAQKELGWKPKHSDLDSMIQTTWDWMNQKDAR